MSLNCFLEYLYILSLFIPEYFKISGGLLNLIYWILEGIRIGISIYYIGKLICKRKVSVLFVTFLFFNLSILISTFINNSSLGIYKTWINSSIPSLGIMAYIEIKAVGNKIDLSIMKRVLEILMVINLLFMIVNPNGVYIATINNLLYDTSRHMTSYFLSVKNRLIIWMIPLTVILQIEKKNKGKIEYLVFTVIMFLQLVICKSVTSIVTLMALNIGYIIIEKRKDIKGIIFKSISVYIVSVILLIYFHIQNLFSHFIVGVLNKNLLLQGRVYIWDISIEMIKNKLLFGYGNAGNGSIIQWAGYMWYSHNLLLDILIQGGIIALLWIILASLYLICMEKKQNLDKKYNLDINIVAFGNAAFLLLGIFESYLNFPQFYMLIAYSGILMKKIYIKY